MPDEVMDYSFDFPELAEEPSKTYAQTLREQGVSAEEIGMRLLVLDIQVMLLVDAMQAPTHLAFVAPESISVARVLGRLDLLGITSSEEPETRELLACVKKATKVLRGEMKPNSIWPSEQVS